MFPNINKRSNRAKPPTLAPNIAQHARTGNGFLPLPRISQQYGAPPFHPQSPLGGNMADKYKSKDNTFPPVSGARPTTPVDKPKDQKTVNPVAAAGSGKLLKDYNPRSKEDSESHKRMSYRVFHADKKGKRIDYKAQVGWTVPKGHKGALVLVVTSKDAAARTITIKEYEISDERALLGEEKPITIDLAQNVECYVRTPDGALASKMKTVEVYKKQPVSEMGGRVGEYLPVRRIYPNYKLTKGQIVSDGLFAKDTAKIAEQFADLHIGVLKLARLKSSDDDSIPDNLKDYAIAALADMGLSDTTLDAVTSILPIVKQVKSAASGTYNLIKAGTTRYYSYKLRTDSKTVDKFYVYYPRPKTAYSALASLANYRQAEARGLLYKACRNYAQLATDIFVPGSTIIDTGFTVSDFLYEFTRRILDQLEVEATNAWLDELEKTKSPNTYYAIITYGHVTVACGVVIEYKPGEIIRAAHFTEGSMLTELKEMEVIESNLRKEAVAILLDQRFTLHKKTFAPPTKSVAEHHHEMLKKWAKREENREYDRDYFRYIQEQKIDKDKKK